MKKVRLVWINKSDQRAIDLQNSATFKVDLLTDAEAQAIASYGTFFEVFIFFVVCGLICCIGCCVAVAKNSFG